MRQRHLGTGLLLAAGFLLFYLLQGREALHGYDAFAALSALKDPTQQAPGHILYFPLVRRWWAITGPLGLDGHAALRSLSAVGVATGVLFAQRTALALRLRPGNALALAAAFGCLPDAVYCAAIVEVDGLLLGVSSAVWYLLVRLGRRPTLRRAAALGLSTGSCAGLHGGGQLLLLTGCALLLCWALQRAWQRSHWPRLWRAAGLVAVVVIVHGGLFALLALLAAHQGQLQMAANVLLLQQPWERLPTTLWREWLVPYAPFAVLWAGSLRRRSL